MEYLNTVNEKIADYIAKEEVVETDEVISAYTLFSAIENCKKRLRHVEEIEKGLVDKLNDIYPQITKIEKKGLFNKKKKVNYFREIRHYLDKTRIELTFDAATYDNDRSIYKDYAYSDVYAYSNDTGLDEEVYNEYMDEINTIFSELDYFGSLYVSDSNRTSDRRFYESKLSNKIQCDGFDLEVRFDNYYSQPHFSYNISINEQIASNGHTSAYFYGKENNVQKVINENMIAILKNTPVNTKDLSHMFYIIVQDYRNMTKQGRIDEEIDKAFQKLYAKK